MHKHIKSANNSIERGLMDLSEDDVRYLLKFLPLSAMKKFSETCWKMRNIILTDQRYRKLAVRVVDFSLEVDVERVRNHPLDIKVKIPYIKKLKEKEVIDFLEEFHSRIVVLIFSNDANKPTGRIENKEDLVNNNQICAKFMNMQKIVLVDFHYRECSFSGCYVSKDSNVRIMIELIHQNLSTWNYLELESCDHEVSKLVIEKCASNITNLTLKRMFDSTGEIKKKLPLLRFLKLERCSEELANSVIEGCANTLEDLTLYFIIYNSSIRTPLPFLKRVTVQGRKVDLSGCSLKTQGGRLSEFKQLKTLKK